MSFPQTRMRRLRGNPQLRDMLRETRLSADQFVYPMFVCHGKNVRNEIGSMPGCAQLSPDLLGEECKAVAGLGIPAIILFGIPEKKDPKGIEAYAEHGIVPTAISKIKEAVPEGGDRRDGPRVGGRIRII